METFYEIIANISVLVLCALCLKPIRILSQKIRFPLQPKKQKFEVLFQEWMLLPTLVGVLVFLFYFKGQDLLMFAGLTVLSWTLLIIIEGFDKGVQKVVFLTSGIAICALIAQINNQNRTQGHFQSYGFFENEHGYFEREESTWVVDTDWKTDCNQVLNKADAQLSADGPGLDANWQAALTRCNQSPSVFARVKYPGPVLNSASELPTIADD